MQRLFLMKPLAWAYEEEVRVVKLIGGLTEDKLDNDAGYFHLVDKLWCYKFQKKQ